MCLRHNRSRLAQYLLRQLHDLPCVWMYVRDSELVHVTDVYSRTFRFQFKISLRRYYWWINLNKQIFNFGEISPQWDLFTLRNIFFMKYVQFVISFVLYISFYSYKFFFKVAYIYFWLLKYLKKCLPYCTTVHGEN